MILHFIMQEEDIIYYTNVKCHVLHIWSTY